MKIYLIISAILLILQGTIHSQEIITGTIKSVPDNKPVEFIHIAVKGTSVGTISNVDGTFELKLESFTPGMVLVISGIGYETKEIKLDSPPEKRLKIKIKSKEYGDTLINIFIFRKD